MIRKHGWLSQTPKAFQDEILKRSRVVDAAADAQLTQIGDAPSGMYGLVEGALAVTVAHEDSIQEIAHLCRPGNWFGDSSILSQRPNHFGLRCTRQSTLRYLPLSEIDIIIGHDPTSWRLFALAILKHLDAAIDAASGLRIRDPSQRCIAILLSLGGYRETTADSSSIEIDISQSDLAEMVNLSRNATAAILRRVELLGHIDCGYKKIRINSAAGLRHMLANATIGKAR